MVVTKFVKIYMVCLYFYDFLLEDQESLQPSAEHLKTVIFLLFKNLSIIRHHVFSLYGLVIRVPRCTFSFSHFNQMIII